MWRMLSPCYLKRATSRLKLSTCFVIGAILVRNSDGERLIELGKQLTDEKERANYFSDLVPNLFSKPPGVLVDKLETLPSNR